MKNWRTTLIGMVTAAAGVAAQCYQVGQGQPVNWGQVGIYAGLAALGYLAKDAGVSGTDK